MSNTPRLSIRDLCKSYSVPVLTDVSIDVPAGTVHALVGENGAGKSTLVNIIAGLVTRDSGEIRLNGQTHAPQSCREAISAGISLVSQELGVIETLTVAENVSLRNLPRRGLQIDRAVAGKRAREVLQTVGGGHIEPGHLAAGLSLADKQLVEIAKAICDPFEVLILDEPTSALTETQADVIHQLIRDLAAKGCSVIYISHRLNDVLNVADHVTVLRDGKVASSVAVGETCVERMVEEMAGGELAMVEDGPATATGEQPILSLNKVSTPALAGPVDLQLRPGECVGIAGLAGAGKSELLRAVFGLDHLAAGDVSVGTSGESEKIASPVDAIAAGVGYVPEERKTDGIFPALGVQDNIMVPADRWRRINREAECEAGERLIEHLGIRCTGPGQAIGELSGGNQQKALLARWLNRDARVLLLDEPTRGVDVRTKHTIYDLLMALKREGRAILFASSETDELRTLADRVLVLSRGRPAAILEHGQWTDKDLLTAAFSGHKERDVA